MVSESISRLTDFVQKDLYKYGKQHLFYEPAENRRRNLFWREPVLWQSPAHMIRKKNAEAFMGYINRRNSFTGQSEKRLSPYREPFLCAEEIEGKAPEVKQSEEKNPEKKESGEMESQGRESERKRARERELAGKKSEEKQPERAGFSSVIPVDFSNPTDEMQTERDFRMLQSMYPNAAKELLPYIEEECDRMEYEGSAMFDEYPDFTTVYSVQKKITEAAARGRMEAGKKAGAAGQSSALTEDAAVNMGENVSTKMQADEICVPYGDLIRVMVLQEMHRRRERYRFCRSQC